MRQWIWLRQDVILAIHEVQLAEHGGGSGLRDSGLLQSAIARPENLAAYGEPDAAELAAAYGYGLSRNHAFIDGNKRTGYVAAELFLQFNGFSLTAEDADATVTMMAVSAGDITEKQYAAWLRMHIVELPS